MDRKIVQIERGNVVLQVPEENVQRYLDQGYNRIDDKGNVIQASVPRDIGTLQMAYLNQQKEIETLKAKIAQYERQPKTRKPSSSRKKD